MWPVARVISKMRRSVSLPPTLLRAVSASTFINGQGPMKQLKPLYGLWIDGMEQGSANGDIFFEVENPATGEVVSSVVDAQPEDMERAIQSAAAAHKDGRWSSMDMRARSRILFRAAEILRERISHMAALETLQTGRCVREYNAQLARIPEWFEYHASLAQTIEGSVPPLSDPDHLCYVRRVPLGVCGLITSWNHPLLIANKKISVALAAGNTVVVKPSPFAPCSVIEMAAVLKEAGVPDGVVQVVPSSGAAVGKTLTTHPDIAKIDLTGGTETGFKIGAAAGRSAKRFTAELGGNAPVLVFEDHDVDTVVNGVAFAAFVASGQTCVSAKRIIIQDTIYDEFVTKLVAKVNGLRLLNPMDMNSQMGPVVNAAAKAKVADQVNQAIAAGAVALAGASSPSINRCALADKGHWYEPTVLRIPGPENPAFQEEIFGPCVTVLPFSNEDMAVKYANDSRYGLGGAIWTKDVNRAHRIAQKVRAGIFWVNAHHRNDPSCPWGGFGDSGIGRENGHEAFREYTETQSVVLRMAEEPEDWFGIADSRYS